MAAGSCPALNLPRCEPTPGPRYEWEGCRGCSWGASVCRGVGAQRQPGGMVMVTLTVLMGVPFPPGASADQVRSKWAAPGPSLPLSRLACPLSRLQQFPRP